MRLAVGGLVYLFLVLSLTVSGHVVAQDPAEFADGRAKDLLTSARIAITGGPNGIARLRSLTLKGRSRIPESGGTLIDAAVHIRVLLPDHYIRVDSGTFGRRITGYAGNASLNLIENGDHRSEPNPRDVGVLEANRFALARFMLGIATYASNEVQLVLETRGTVKEMPGAADPLGMSASSARGFAARLILDAKSRLPARLIYWDADRTVATMTFADHKSVGGLRLPYHIVVTHGADRVVDEMTFDEILVNPSLSKADFTK